MTVLATPEVEVVTHGPTWQRDDDGLFILPERTLGWQIIDWCSQNLNSPEFDELGNPLPWQFSDEQARLILWIYAVDERGRFVYRDVVLQRLKGWGKDPFAAVLAAIEFVGPCRFDRWATEADVAAGLAFEVGDPIGRDNPVAWVQATAVAREQNKNLMSLFPGLFTKECIAKHSIDLNKEIIYAYHGARRIEAVTSAPRTMEGNRPTFVIRNETHHWLANNDGHEMAKVIRRNLGKIKGGQARAISITNAFDPNEESFAKKQREAYMGRRFDVGTMYDSLEAGPSVDPYPPEIEGEEVEAFEARVRAWVEAIVTAVRGDSTWIDVERIAAEILNPETSESEARRFYLNQIVANEEAWVDPADVAETVHSEMRRRRAERGIPDQIRLGWEVVDPDEPVVLFGDGSKSDDATAIVGCRLSDGYLFTVGVWEKPPKLKGWQAPRGRVGERVDEAMERFNVVAFWFDPSHAKDDEEGTRYWDSLVDTWHRDYGERFQKNLWAVQGGTQQHSIMWDMASPARTAEFVGAAEGFLDEMNVRAIIHDGNPLLVQHMLNAYRSVGRYGVSLRKEHRESVKKIDLAVCAVGARLLRRHVLNRGLEVPEKTGGAVWW